MISTLKEIEDFIFSNEKQFLNDFCAYYDAEIIGVSFDHDSIIVVILLESGQHIKNVFSMDEFVLWMSS